MAKPTLSFIFSRKAPFAADRLAFRFKRLRYVPVAGVVWSGPTALMSPAVFSARVSALGVPGGPVVTCPDTIEGTFSRFSNNIVVTFKNAGGPLNGNYSFSISLTPP